MSTRYFEQAIVTTCFADIMRTPLETIWFHRHGALTHFLPAPEFCKPFLKESLSSNSISLEARSSRSLDKNGVMERNTGVLKHILARLQKENILLLHHIHWLPEHAL